MAGVVAVAAAMVCLLRGAGVKEGDCSHEKDELMGYGATCNRGDYGNHGG